MNDIVERLRRLENNPYSTHPKGMLDEAADEIERLRLSNKILSDETGLKRYKTAHAIEPLMVEKKHE